jgi:hypothetical protein
MFDYLVRILPDSEQDAFAAEGERIEEICINEYLEGA